MDALMAVFLGAIAVLFASALYAAVVTGRRMMREDGRLRLFDAVRGQGLALPGPLNESEVHEAALAARRCAACAGHARCDELLAAGDWNALREICPNTAYIDRLRSG